MGNAQSLSYNITGQGLLRTFLYPRAQDLYKFLNKFNYDTKFHNTRQLGALQYLFKGAHHTRYEYIFLQWTLIHYVKETSKGLGLNTEIDFGNKRITPADLLQCLAILVNMGHFPDTFSASKVWLHLLKKNHKGLRTTFKQGLQLKDKHILDKIIQEFDFHNIHIVDALFLLGRYKKANNGNEQVEFSKQVLIEYCNQENEEFKPYWGIYKIIRKISYILMDSNYAPVPFKLDLAPIILNLDHYEDELTTEDSVFNATLNQMNNMLENSLYLAPNSILTSTLRSYYLFDQIQKCNNDNLNKTSKIRRILEPFNQDNSSLSSVFQQLNDYSDFSLKWDYDNVLDIKYLETDYPVNYFNKIFPNDIFEFEKELNNKLGMKMCTVSAFNPPSKNNFRIAISINLDLEHHKKIKKALEISKTVIDTDSDFIKKGLARNDRATDEFKSRLLVFLLKYTFGNTNRYHLEYDFLNKSVMPLFIGKGSVKVSKLIRDYINQLDVKVDKDILHELRVTLQKVESLDYRGLIITYLGSTKILKQNSKRSDCEFDGLIFLPMRAKGEFLHVLEAKNKRSGSSEAENQLNLRMSEFLSNSLCYSINHLDDRAACASVSIR